jgi:hypothetical protein
MPVGDKIEDIGIQFVFTKSQIGFIDIRDGRHIIVAISSKESKFKRTYEAVIEFIKWYNEQEN